MSSLGSGKSRHPLRNSRLLFLVRRLSFTTSTKYYGLSLLDTSNMFTLVRITADFAPVELSPTHCPLADLDVSLKGFPPSEVSSPFAFDTLSRIRFFIALTHFCKSHHLGIEKKFPEKQKSSQIFGNKLNYLQIFIV